MMIGFSLKSVQAERFKSASGAVQLNYGTKIDNISEEDFKVYSDKVAKIDFGFDIEYSADKDKIGEIHFLGVVIWKGNLKEIIDAWKNDKKLAQEVKSQVINRIYQKCLINAVGLSESLGLPAPVPIPVITVNPKKGKK